MGKLSQMAEVGRAHCEVAIHLAERFGFDEPFRRALFQAFERWDGTGKPIGVKGEEIALGMRIAHVAIDANCRASIGRRGRRGRTHAEARETRFGSRSGRAIRERRGALVRPMEDPSPWSAAMAAEPGPHRTVEGDAIDEGLRAIAHFTGAPLLLVINGVEPGAIAEVKRVEKETGLVVRYVLSPGGGHHVLMDPWVDAFPQAAILLGPARTLTTIHGLGGFATGRPVLRRERRLARRCRTYRDRKFHSNLGDAVL